MRRLIPALLLLVAACGEPKLHGARFEQPTAAPALSIARADGARFDLAAQRGAHVLLFFGYTHCPDICPTTLSDWARAKQALGADTTGVRWVFVTVDPARDTPEVAQRYAARFDPSFVGLSPTETELAALKQAWGFAAWSEAVTPADTVNYTVAHPAYAMLVDRQGRLAVRYPFGVRGADLAADLKALR